MSTLASIPSPSFNSIDIGPLSLNIYGLAIALGVVAAVWLFGRRLEERGVGTSDDASSIAVWAVLAGVVGARLYHVATDWERFANNYSNIPKLWEGGLGIPGGLLLGIPVGLYVAKERGIPLVDRRHVRGAGDPVGAGDRTVGQLLQPGAVRTADRPAVGARDRRRPPGRQPGDRRDVRRRHDLPPDVPLRIAVESRHRVRAVVHRSSLASPRGLTDGAVPRVLRRGRFWVEGLRVDPADDVGPFRWNQWVALGAIVVGLGLFFVLRNRPDADPVIDFEVDDEFGLDASDDGDVLDDDEFGRDASLDGGEDAVDEERNSDRSLDDDDDHVADDVPLDDADDVEDQGRRATTDRQAD